MRFIKATIFTILSSSTAVLGELTCDDPLRLPSEYADGAVKVLEQYYYDRTCGGTPGNGTHLASYRTAHVYGVAVDVDETSSDCKDVIPTVQEIASECLDGKTGGSQFARGNGNLLIKLTDPYCDDESGELCIESDF